MSRVLRGIALFLAFAWPLRPALAASTAPPPSPRELLADAKRAADRAENAAAQRLAERVLSQPTDPALAEEARLLLIDVLLAQESPMPAFEQCEKFLDLHPHSVRRNDILRREFEIAQSLAEARGTVMRMPTARFQDALRVFEKVIEHAPFGPLADPSLFAMAEAHRQQGNYEEARGLYERLLKNYPHSSLTRRAIVGRTACNYHLSQLSPNDPKPAEEAARDLDLLAQSPGGASDLLEQRDTLRDTIARGDYEAALFYFRSGNITAGIRCFQTLLARHPGSAYAPRARRILEEGIIARFPDTEYAQRAQRALAASAPPAGDRKENP